MLSGGRVPFAMAGILMILMAAMTSAFLFKGKAGAINSMIEDGEERGLNEALAFAKADIDRALNMAGMTAESMIGERPVIASNSGVPEEVNLKRMRVYTRDLFAAFLDAGYSGGTFIYGDYVITASVRGDERDILIEPLNMSMERDIDSPVLPCDTKYEAYYVISAPVVLNLISGTGDRYFEDYRAGTLVTSRYPLLRSLCEEYEDRMNGTPLFIDVTASALAYTIARGYCQYATTEPMNIVDNGHLELIVNGASLLEQGFVFNSVDPMSLAWLAVKAGTSLSGNAAGSINKDTYSGKNAYDVKRNANESLAPYGGPASRNPEYGFNADSIIDDALVRSFGGDIKALSDRAYACNMSMTISVVSTETAAGSGIELLSSSRYPGTGLPVIASERWEWRGNGIKKLATIDYILGTSSGADVIGPYDGTVFEGHADENLANAVSSYKSAIGFDTAIGGVLSSAPSYGINVLPASFISSRGRWLEPEAEAMLASLSGTMKSDLRLTLTADDYASPGETVVGACSRMEGAFEEKYPYYLSESAYIDGGKFKSCGAKALFNVRRSFLDNIREGFNGSTSSATGIAESINSNLSSYGVNTSALSYESSKSLLESQLYVPFGLSPALTGGSLYPWEEEISVAVDQKPDYLSVTPYVDKNTGYSTYPLKVRNVCLFSFPVEMLYGNSPAVLNGIGSVYDASAGDTSMRQESSALMSNISSTTRQELKNELAETLLNDPEVSGAFTRQEIDAAVDRAFAGESDREIIDGLSDGSLASEVSEILTDRTKWYALGLNDSTTEYRFYLANKTRILSQDAGNRSVSSALAGMNQSIQGNFQRFMNVSQGTTDPGITAALKAIPMGLPLLPPYGYWATLNVWYIEADGEIPRMTVYDADSESLPDAVFGHRAPVYVRQRDVVDDGMGCVGYNLPVKFNVDTATFILVPYGGTGVGDRTGGWDEKSPGYHAAAVP